MFGRKPNGILDLFERELIRQHSLARTISQSYEAQKNITKMVETLNQLVLAYKGDEEKRLKEIEDAIGDLYLTGRDKK